MARVASFHLVRERPWRSALAMARLGTDRLRLARVEGLVFWRLLGTGRGDDTGPSADPRRTALFAVWDDEAALDGFLAGSPVAQRWERAEEAWHVRLRGAGGHGTWRGVDPLAGLVEGATDGPLAIITRADVHRRSWRAFRAAGPAVSEELRTADGLLAVVGIGEAPVGRLGTFSLWRSLADVRHFAVGMPHHREVVRRTRDENWYGEELFARFEPYASSGSWGGADPLA
jgi:heme-degrading monooxygenase HmoA